MESDEALYLRVKQGDLRAFDDLYARYEGPLFGFLVSQLGNHADAEDVFHEAFLGALKTREVTFERGGGFRTWLYRIARNLTSNRLRSERRGVRAVARLPSGDHAPPAEEALVERELFRALDEAIARLSPALADVYRLRCSGLSYEEIADVLETPLGTVKSRMNQMVNLLREELRPWTAR